MNVKKLIHNALDNYQSVSYKDMIEKIKSYEYVSFDIFDNLVKRDVPKPTDVFTLIGEQFHIDNFKALRIKAEIEARAKSEAEEVSIDEIYDSLQGVESKEAVKEYELNLEVEIATPNLEINKTYQYCIENKKVILISDMYLPRSTVEKILNKCGIVVYQKLYLSNEVNKTKASGSLYEYVKAELNIKNREVIHIGNSFKADYMNPKKKKLTAIKIATYFRRTAKEYGYMLCENEKEKKSFLKAFLNNHTVSGEEVSPYYQFGFERFGPLLFGFINWLYQDMKKEGIEQVFFLARDGYIMRKVYTLLDFGKVIGDYYFEASRRSLRIPTYKRTMEYEDILKELTVPNKTNIIQIFDSFGLDAGGYKDVIEGNGISFDEQIKRDALINNQAVRNIFNIIKDDLMTNAEEEDKLLRGYLSQYDFNKKTAIVDIGWGGSMQKYLTQTLNRMGISHDIIGYYVGLTEKSIDNIGKAGLKAKGYAFDRLNGISETDMERPFVGLFETLFLEQSGSVMKYKVTDDGFVALRYPYEYLDENGNPTIEAIHISEIQEGALKFIKEFSRSSISKWMGTDSRILFSNLYETGINPIIKDVELFGYFNFFNNGSKVHLAKPRSLFYYVVHINALKKDLFDSQWKVGFLKGLLKIKLPYLKLFGVLRKASN